MIVFGRGEVLDIDRLIGMGKLLILTCGQIALLVVNVICEDFAGLTVIGEPIF
jgi:hypothetical protein